MEHDSLMLLGTDETHFKQPGGGRGRVYEGKRNEKGKYYNDKLSGKKLRVRKQ